MEKRRAVFLDRDGVINETVFRDGKPRAPDRVKEFRIFPGVREACERLRAAGFLLVVVTNQPDVSRGWLTRESVEAMNEIVARELRVDDIQVCYHDDADGCDCRKPKPGMLLKVARALDIDLRASFLVGDREGDIFASQAAGCVAILVGSDGGAATPAARVRSLAEAAEWILDSGFTPTAADSSC
jgi:D-glycero-D-manno-heptose 1,7-bisphosphate phosphatase